MTDWPPKQTHSELTLCEEELARCMQRIADAKRAEADSRLLARTRACAS